MIGGSPPAELGDIYNDLEDEFVRLNEMIENGNILKDTPEYNENQLRIDELGKMLELIAKHLNSWFIYAAATTWGIP